MLPGPLLPLLLPQLPLLLYPQPRTRPTSPVTPICIAASPPSPRCLLTRSFLSSPQVLKVLVERARRGDVVDSLRRGGGRHGSISMRLAGLRQPPGPDEVGPQQPRCILYP